MAPADKLEGIRLMDVGAARGVAGGPGRVSSLARASPADARGAGRAHRPGREASARRPRSRSGRCGIARGVAPTRPGGGAGADASAVEPMVLLTMRTALPKPSPARSRFRAARSMPATRAPAAAALREAEEEIGLARDLIEPIGYLDLYLTFSGFRILPAVRASTAVTRLRAQRSGAGGRLPSEVPLAFPDGLRTATPCSRDWKGIGTLRTARCRSASVTSGGVTAGIVRDLL